MFDDYLINILFDSFNSELTDNNILKKHLNKIKIIIKTFYFSWKLIQFGRTEGQGVYNIQFDIKSINYPHLRLVGYSLFKVLFPYLIEKIESYISKEYLDEENMSKINKIFLTILQMLILIFKVSDYINFLLFLASNKFPSVWNRVFGLKYVS
jgi:hypothetical protein